jgi:hypothetical protein
MPPFLEIEGLFPRLSHYGVSPFSALTLDAVHKAASPDEFCGEQAQAKQNHDQPRPRSDEHRHACQQQGKSSDNEEDSADLLNRAEDHGTLR